MNGRLSGAKMRLMKVEYEMMFVFILKPKELNLMLELRFAWCNGVTCPAEWELHHGTFSHTMCANYRSIS